MRKVIVNILFGFGISVCMLPFILNILSKNEQSELISSYNVESAKLSNGKKDKEIEKAKKYNEYQYNLQCGSKTGKEVKYEDVLATNEVMCTLSIPKINVELPVYHNADEKVLAKGLGHIKETSVPIGGKNTHSFITGHRGLPSSKLFVRLDEMKKGDMFYVHIFDETLAYKVEDIQVVLPDDTKSMRIQEGKDLVSLVTCTPYGLNTHRLIVTGERTKLSKEDKAGLRLSSRPGFRELAFSCTPLLLCALFIVDKVKERGKK